MSNIPKLRFPEFKGEWEEKRLNSIFTKITQRNSDNQNSNVITNSATEGLVSQRDYFDKDIANKDKTDNYFIIKNSDFVYNPRKSSAAPYGPFTQYKLLNDGIVSPLYLCLRKNNSEVESKYLENYFKTTCWHQYIYENGSSGARHDRVSIHDDVLLAMPIKVPTLAEQQKIADFLSNVDSIITAETKILNILQKKKKALMQKLFTQQLRFKSDDGTDFPAWEETLIKNIAHQVTVGIANSATHAYRADGVIMFRNQNIKENYLDDTDIIYISNDFEETYKNKRLKKYDILVTRTGYPGIACVVPEKYENAQTFTTLILRLKLEECNPFYICQFINSPLGKKYIKLTQIGGGQKNSGAGILEKMPIKLPCIEEQQKIANCLSSMDSLIQNQQKVVTTWQQRKKALLQQMFI